MKSKVNRDSSLSSCSLGPLPPWKKELLLRRNALAKTVDPNASVIAEFLESNERKEPGCSALLILKRPSTHEPAKKELLVPSLLMVEKGGALVCTEEVNTSPSTTTSTSSSTTSGNPRPNCSKRRREEQRNDECGGEEEEEVEGCSQKTSRQQEAGAENEQEKAEERAEVDLNLHERKGNDACHISREDRQSIFSSEEERTRDSLVPSSSSSSFPSYQVTKNFSVSRGSGGVGRSYSKSGSSTLKSLPTPHPLLNRNKSSPCSIDSEFKTSSSSFNSILSGMILASPAIVVTDQEESLILMDKSRLPKASSSSLDSDDGSSSSSSSTEELRYGPGFVSRLKSRYMSAALRSTHFNNLRRTASLEDFLEKDEEEPPLLPRRTWLPRQSHNNNPHQKISSSSTSHYIRSRDSMKRCKSVEVLSRNRLPSDQPPPLPPKVTHRSPLDLNATKALIPDRVIVRDKKTKELPAQDIVKQTRKLFESKSPSSSPNSVVSSSSSRVTSSKQEEIPPALPAKNVGKLLPSRIVDRSENSVKQVHKTSNPLKVGTSFTNNASSKNALELPPKQIGVIRPITRSNNNTGNKNSSNSVCERNQKNKIQMQSEVLLVSDKTTQNILSNSAPSMTTSTTTTNNNNNATKSSLSSSSSSSSSSGFRVPKSATFGSTGDSSQPKEMCEFKSIVLKEVKKELNTNHNNSGSDNTKWGSRGPHSSREEQGEDVVDSTGVSSVQSIHSRFEAPTLVAAIKEAGLKNADKGSEESGVLGETSEKLLPDVVGGSKSKHSQPLVESKNITFRDSWKQRNEGKNTLVFNFINSKKDVSHIENDGLDFSKRKSMSKSQSGVIILDSVISDESTDDDGTGIKLNSEDEDDDEEEFSRPPSPCSIIFVGGNLISGKSSLRSGSHKQSEKKLNISFSSSLEEVFEYPSFESSLSEDNSQSKFGGGGGGLGSYTPSKIQMSEAPFQLGVSRRPSSLSQGNSESSVSSSLNNSITAKKDEEEGGEDQVLRPVEDAVSWSGSSSSSDILF